MKKKKLVIGLFILFICLLSLTIYTSFSSNIEEQKIVIKNMTPVYDETSTIEVDNNNVIFNDKNQVVKYNVVLENTQNYDVKISDIKLSTPTEEFLSYKVEGINTEDVISANSTKELTVSFETIGIKGWGRNFIDELTANISFEKVVKQEEVVPPVEEEKNEEKQPEAPATNIEEIVDKAEKIKIEKITNNTIEFKDDIKVEEGEKVAVWIYSKPKFLGHFDVVVTNVIKQIVGLEEAIKKAEITPGEHSIVLSTEEKEVLGYVNVYIDENKGLLIEKPQDTTDKEEDKTAEDESKEEIDNKDESISVNKPSTDNKEENPKEEENKVENPYTSDKELVGILGIATCITGVAIIIVSKNKFAKYTVFLLMLSPTLTITNAEEVIEVAITNKVSFESQNVMQPADCAIYEWGGIGACTSIWKYNIQIENIFIQNEIKEIEEYEYKFDVTNDQNGRVMAYLIRTSDEYYTCYFPDRGDDMCHHYNLYIQADGIIYPNENASYYFYDMKILKAINNLEGFDTSNVTNMSYMFFGTGRSSTTFTLDLSNFDTSKVTDMSHMFQNTGYTSKSLYLDLSSFDTSNVTNMKYMFSGTGSETSYFNLNVRNFDTSNVTDMSYMFDSAGYWNENFTLDVSNFNTSNVTNMESMFERTGYNSTNFTLDVSNFDTSKVKDMRSMFLYAGFNSTNINIQLTIRSLDIEKVELYDEWEDFYYTKTGYESMFHGTALRSDSKITVNYTSETEELVDKIIASVQPYCVEEQDVWNEEDGYYELICVETLYSNVVKGVQVD